MAWLYQRGKKWWIGYYGADGKRVRKSISDSKDIAELALRRVEAELEQKNAPDHRDSNQMTAMQSPRPSGFGTTPSNR